MGEYHRRQRYAFVFDIIVSAAGCQPSVQFEAELLYLLVCQGSWLSQSAACSNKCVSTYQRNQAENFC